MNTMAASHRRVLLAGRPQRSPRPCVWSCSVRLRRLTLPQTRPRPAPRPAAQCLRRAQLPRLPVAPQLPPPQPPRTAQPPPRSAPSPGRVRPRHGGSQMRARANRCVAAAPALQRAGRALPARPAAALAAPRACGAWSAACVRVAPPPKARLSAIALQRPRPGAHVRCYPFPPLRSPRARQLLHERRNGRRPARQAGDLGGVLVAAVKPRRGVLTRPCG